MDLNKWNEKYGKILWNKSMEKYFGINSMISIKNTFIWGIIAYFHKTAFIWGIIAYFHKTAFIWGIIA